MIFHHSTPLRNQWTNSFHKGESFDGTTKGIRLRADKEWDSQLNEIEVRDQARKASKFVHPNLFFFFFFYKI